MVRGGEKHRIVIRQSKGRKNESFSRPGSARVATKGANQRTAKAVMVFNVLRLIWAGMNANMKLGTLSKSCERVSPRVAACIKNVTRNLRTDVESP